MTPESIRNKLTKNVMSSGNKDLITLFKMRTDAINEVVTEVLTSYIIMNCPKTEDNLINIFQNNLANILKYVQIKDYNTAADKLWSFDILLVPTIKLSIEDCQKEHMRLQEEHDFDELLNQIAQDLAVAPSQDNSQHSSTSIGNDDDFSFASVFDNEYNTEEVSTSTPYNTQALGSIAADNGYGYWAL
jgi:hypothetical protein